MAQPQRQATISLYRFYINKVDFKATSVEQNGDEPLGLDIEIGTGYDKSLNNFYFVVFNIKINNSESPQYILNIEAVGIFETEGEVDDEFMRTDFVNSSSPAIVFPFVRSYVNTFTSLAGLPPTILPTFNFTDVMAGDIEMSKIKPIVENNLQ